jgi:hypothetical protein
MKKDKKLFEQAILDAKSIRDTATLNAKLALEEQLTPKLREMLAKKLQEQEEGKLQETEELDENENLDEELDLDEILNELDLEENGESQLRESFELDEADDSEKKDAAPKKDSAPKSDSKPSAPKASSEPTDLGDVAEDGVSDEDKISSLTVGDLKLILQDLIAAEMSAGEPGLGEPGLEDPAVSGVDDLGAGPEMGMDSPEMGHDMMPAGDFDDEEDINLEELLAELEQMNQEGLGAKLKAGAQKIGQKVATAAKNFASDVAPSSVKPGGKHYNNRQQLPTNKSFSEGQELDEAEELQQENAALKAELNEAKKAVNVYKKELHEQNLLNAKLLYVNKIFKAKNLTESQKVRVITTFDKVTSVKDAKLVYEALNSAGIKNNVAKKPITESRGFASKPAGIAPKTPIVDNSNAQIEQWQRLAGIKKNRF